VFDIDKAKFEEFKYYSKMGKRSGKKLRQKMATFIVLFPQI
jgi:hypothetical protein